MATRVFMPKAGMAMEEGTILTWFKQEGDRVEEGEPLLEIETDKVNMEVESPANGVLLAITQPEGQVVEVTRTIGWIGQPGEEVPEEDQIPADQAEVAQAGSNSPAPAAAMMAVVSGGKIPATPAARDLAKRRRVNLTLVSPSGAFGEVKLRDVQAAAQVRATPLASKMALDMGVNLYALSGSGAGGKIVEQDILAASRTQGAALAEAAAHIQHTPLTPMRKRIAERMLQSHQQAPPVTLNVEAEVTELLKRRKSYNASRGVGISINDLLLKATAMALKEFPPINARLEGDRIVHHQVVNLGMAVALDEGLVVPVIREAEKLSLQGIARQAADLAQRAQQGRIMPDELSGGTFTVSNLGAFGIVSFTPILNPPEAGILGVCAVQDVVKPVGDGFEARKIMGLSLTFDHRVVDGAQGAIFLQKVVKLLENPLLLMA